MSTNSSSGHSHGTAKATPEGHLMSLCKFPPMRECVYKSGRVILFSLTGLRMVFCCCCYYNNAEIDIFVITSP
jgi:hypothetical protein